MIKVFQYRFENIPQKGSRGARWAISSFPTPEKITSLIESGAVYYELVAEINTHTLDEAFEKTNSITQPWWENDLVCRFSGDKCRSTMVGDIFLEENHVTGQRRYNLCLGFGFMPIEFDFELHTHVHSMLNNAVENEFDLGTSAELIALDLVEFDSECESKAPEDLIPHVSSWLERRKAVLK